MKKSTEQKPAPLRILVIESAFVMVGRVSMSFMEDDVVAKDRCAIVRSWGTDKGLGQIAYGGPTSNTALDPQPRTVVNAEQILFEIDCVNKAWGKAEDDPFKLLVISHGFILSGQTAPYGSTAGQVSQKNIIVDGCAIVRSWGTDKGLGQIAYGGPTKNTVLDPQPRTVVNRKKWIYAIDCNEDAWKKACESLK